MSNKLSILQSARNLFMKYGVKSVSMDDISKALGLSKKTLYNFIENKKDLIYQVMENFINEDEAVIQDLRKHSKDAVDEMILLANHVLQFLRTMKPSLTYDLIKYHPKTWKLIDTRHMGFIREMIRENVIRGMKEGLYRNDLDPDIIAEMYVAHSRLMTNEDVFPLKKYQMTELYLSQIYYHINGIVNSKGSSLFKKYLKDLK